MTKFGNVIIIITVFLLTTCSISAQVDPYGSADTVWAELVKIDDLHWSVNVSYFNDQPVVAMSVPLKFSSGLNQVVADSCIYKGGRVENFAVRAFRADTAIQCVTLGMISTLSGVKKSLQPGKGRLATIFLSSLIDEPIEKLHVDTTTTHPNNTLEIIVDSVQRDMKISDMQKRRVIPVFITRMSE